MHSPVVPVVVLIFASVLWGLSWLPLKALNSLGFEGIPLLLVSNLILVVVFLYPAIKHLGAMRKNAWPLVAIGFFGGGAILCFTYALIYGEVIRVMVLFYLLPVWGVLGGMFFLGEKPDWIRWLGVVLAIGGAFLILGAFNIFKEPPSILDLLALLSGLFFAANNLCFRGAQSVPLRAKLFCMFCGCTGLSLALVLVGVQQFPSELAGPSWVWLIVYSLTWLLCANLGSQWAVTQMEAGRSSIIIIVELVVAVISALIIAGERLEPVEWVGCLMVVVAALLEALRDFKENG